MATLASIRDKLESKVFSKIGSAVLVASTTANSTDKWGDASITYAAGASATAVPYDYYKANISFRPFGDLKEGEVVMVFKYDQTINVTDKVTFQSTDYIVKRIEEFFFQDGVIAKQVLLAKKLA
jgi:hypothetical protein